MKALKYSCSRAWGWLQGWVRKKSHLSLRGEVDCQVGLGRHFPVLWGMRLIASLGEVRKKYPHLKLLYGSVRRFCGWFHHIFLWRFQYWLQLEMRSWICWTLDFSVLYLVFLSLLPFLAVCMQLLVVGIVMFTCMYALQKEMHSIKRDAVLNRARYSYVRDPRERESTLKCFGLLRNGMWLRGKLLRENKHWGN